MTLGRSVPIVGRASLRGARWVAALLPAGIWPGRRRALEPWLVEARAGGTRSVLLVSVEATVTGSRTTTPSWSGTGLWSGTMARAPMRTRGRPRAPVMALG
jgi:hypothetical protein